MYIKYRTTITETALLFTVWYFTNFLYFMNILLKDYELQQRVLDYDYGFVLLPRSLQQRNYSHE